VKGSAIKLAELSAQIQTIAAARATLDVAKQNLILAKAYINAAEGHHAKEAPLSTFINSLTGAEADVRQEHLDHIAIVESLVQSLRNVWGDDADLANEEISTLRSMQIANALQRTNSALNDAIDEFDDIPNLDFVDGIATVLRAVATTAGEAATSVIQAASNVTAGLASAFWVPLTVAALAGGAFLLWRYGLLKKATGP